MSAEVYLRWNLEPELFTQGRDPAGASTTTKTKSTTRSHQRQSNQQIDEHPRQEKKTSLRETQPTPNRHPTNTRAPQQKAAERRYDESRARSDTQPTPYRHMTLHRKGINAIIRRQNTTVMTLLHLQFAHGNTQAHTGTQAHTHMYIHRHTQAHSQTHTHRSAHSNAAWT